MHMCRVSVHMYILTFLLFIWTAPVSSAVFLHWKSCVLFRSSSAVGRFDTFRWLHSCYTILTDQLQISHSGAFIEFDSLTSDTVSF